MMTSNPSSHVRVASSVHSKHLDFSVLPPIYVLPAHLTESELHNIEDQIQNHDGCLTYDITEARIVLGKVTTKKRAELELRIRRRVTEEIAIPSVLVASADKHGSSGTDGPRKKRKLSTADHNDSRRKAEDDVSEVSSPLSSPVSSRLKEDDSMPAHGMVVEESQNYHFIDLTQDNSPHTRTTECVDLDDIVQVVKLQWLEDCINQDQVLDTGPYLVYKGRPTERPRDATMSTRLTTTIARTSPREAPKSQHVFAERPTGSAILERAKADAGYAQVTDQNAHYAAAPHGARKLGKQGGRFGAAYGESHTRPIQLMELTTEEYESTSDQEMPPLPEWVRQHQIYACQRVAPFTTPNDDFIEELKKIRLARILTNDEIGVRAYSTSIASLAAYPHKLVNPREILRLPGCDVKIANLWIEWKNDGKIRAAEEAQNDPTMKILNQFYEIWGVGATTAREFYYDKGWTDLDDVVEYGWNTLSRVQQIGVKYYDEFQQKIPRSEVEFIASKVREHAVKVRDDGIELIVVGGYRRGKKESGDVDMIVSHRHLDKTAGLVQDIVESLEQEGWITHTLTLALTSTHRNQSTLPFKASRPAHGAGFDTLDKALVVWQDPVWSTMEADLKADPQAKNPNIHRRVDIIISPWRTVGCAVLGWTSGTTFQRDFRRYARNVKGWKFDSSGVRDRSTGEVVELEGPEGVSGSMVDAEKKVFEGFGLEFREPWERCTG